MSPSLKRSMTAFLLPVPPTANCRPTAATTSLLPERRPAQSALRPTANLRRPHRTPTASYSAAPPDAAAPPAARSSAPRLGFTHYDGSSFALEYDAPYLPRPLRVLVDPWLVGDLVFIGQPAFYRGRKNLTSTVPLSALGDWDLIVLSQDLPDHCHVPTLERLPRSVPVVCPGKAVPILEHLGYKSILPLAPGKVTAPFDKDSVLAHFAVRGGRGSVTGPPWSEPQLAFCFEFGGPGDTAPIRAYLETHGTHDADFLAELTRSGPVDVFISPVISMTIPILGNYDVIYGTPELVDICRQVLPRTVVPFDNSRTEGSGALETIVKLEGSHDGFREACRGYPALKDMRIVEPELMKSSIVGGEIAE